MNKLMKLNDTTMPILLDANTRDDHTFANAILAMLAKGTVHTVQANLLNRDDRRKLLILRQHIYNA